MKWEPIYRLSGLKEWVCEHGVGHPDPASVVELNKKMGKGSEGTWGIHGCCGESCCRNEDFPGWVIPLTQGQLSKVSPKDWYALSKYKWYAHWNVKTSSFYAVRMGYTEEGRTLIRMHRFILGLSKGDNGVVDHIDHDTLNNRRSNLRLTTHRGNSENMRNQSKFGAGVWNKGKRFASSVTIDGRHIYVGSFDTPEEAREARTKFLKNPILDKQEKRKSKYGTGVRCIRGRFQAYVHKGGKQFHVGMFDTPEEAIIAREIFKKELFNG